MRTELLRQTVITSSETHTQLSPLLLCYYQPSLAFLYIGHKDWLVWAPISGTKSRMWLQFRQICQSTDLYNSRLWCHYRLCSKEVLESTKTGCSSYLLHHSLYVNAWKIKFAVVSCSIRSFKNRQRKRMQLKKCTRRHPCSVKKHS